MPIAPAISKRPMLVRDVLRYADPRASDLLELDRRPRPAGAARTPASSPLLSLMGVGQVLVARRRVAETRAVRPLRPALPRRSRHRRSPGRPPELRAPLTTSSPPSSPGRSGRGASPASAAMGSPARARGGARPAMRRGPTVVDGDADGITELAAVGMLDARRALFYAGDLRDRADGYAAEPGWSFRLEPPPRRVRGTNDPEPRTDAGCDRSVAAEPPVLQPVLRNGGAAIRQSLTTTAWYLRSPQSISLALVPQYRPYAAFDGRLDTTWLGPPPSP